jgi:translation factor GUF1, mitochondrial
VVAQLGVMAPEMRPTQRLFTGQVGYVITGLKSTKGVRVGDTWHSHKATNVQPLPGFMPAKAMMFAGAPSMRPSL